jgi:hypothetical protein
MAINKREFEALRDRVARLENKLASMESAMKLHDHRLTAKELYRVVKTEEKSKEIEEQMGLTERPL